MIATLLRICWITLLRDRVALLLTFALPIAFFSIFAFIFGGAGGGGETSRITVAVVDEDQSDASRRVIEAIAKEEGLRVRRVVSSEDPTPLDRSAALELIKTGKLPAAVVILPGFSERFGNFANQEPAVELLYDKADPIAAPMVNGLLQKVAMSAAPDLMMKQGFRLFETYGGAFTPQQRVMVETLTKEGMLGEGDGGTVTEPAKSSGAPAFGGPIAVKQVDVLGESKISGLVAFYAAGTGVMFLLFSMAGAAGSLLEEEEAGTLERILGSGMSVGTLLAGKWLFHSLMGIVQISVMFLWGALFFKIELFTHLPGFLIMTIATACSAAAFGLMLAGVCRTRAQLAGISTVVILIMSAVGGSMFPRFLMPEWVQNVGLITFNAWALDGFRKVFWFEQPLVALAPQVGVLAGLTLVFLFVSRVLARRWERV